MTLKLIVSKALIVFYLIILGCVLSVKNASGQNNFPQVSGQLLDPISKKGISLATIAVYRSLDTSLLTYRLSDEHGFFKVSGLPIKTPLRIVITHSEYFPFRQEFFLENTNSSTGLDSVWLTKAVQELEAVIINAEIPPISIRNDTIEFNANSFKTLPNALLEDLLKKLPGVEIDRDGGIRVNGKIVSKIRVDGKDFFGGDIRIATKNLPANIIDRVQVTDDKDEIDRNPEVNKNSIGQVINLKLKKGIKKGWFGKAYAGGGTSRRFELGGILNTFADTMQISMLGYTNNINKPGFGPGDLQELGGFGRSGMNVRSSQGGYSVNGISFGGTNDGIQHSTGTGINFNHELSKKISLNLQYFYGTIKSDVSSKSIMEQTLSDTILTVETRQTATLKDRSHRVAGSLRWKPSKMLTLTYKPSLTIQENPSHGIAAQETKTNYEDPLNFSNNDQLLEESRLSTSHDLVLVKTFVKQGRSLNASSNVTTGSIESDLFNVANSLFYEPNPITTNTSQKRSVDIYSTRASFNVSYAEPLTKNTSVRFSNTFETYNDKDDVNTYHKKNGDQEYDSINSTLSNDFKRRGYKNITTLSSHFKLGRFRISPGIDWTYLHLSNIYTLNAKNRQTKSAIFPKVNLQSQNASLNYSVRLKEPDAIDLQPVVNNANPLSLIKGNPFLMASTIHSVVYNFMRFDYKKGTTWIVYIDGSATKDPIVYSRQTDDKGVQTITPVNIKNNWRAGASVALSKKMKLGKKNSTLLRLSINPNYLKNKAVINGESVPYGNFSMSPNISTSININDVIELNNKYTFSYSKSNYDNPDLLDFEYTSQNLQSELIIRLKNNIIIETSIDYFYNNSLSTQLDKSIVIWNAGLNYLFLKNKQAQVRLSAFDLLNQNARITRSLRDNYLFESQTSVLRRYCMLTFLYNIRKLRTQKVGGKNSLFSF